MILYSKKQYFAGNSRVLNWANEFSDELGYTFSCEINKWDKKYTPESILQAITDVIREFIRRVNVMSKAFVKGWKSLHEGYNGFFDMNMNPVLDPVSNLLPITIKSIVGELDLKDTVLRGKVEQYFKKIMESTDNNNNNSISKPNPKGYNVLAKKKLKTISVPDLNTVFMNKIPKKSVGASIKPLAIAKEQKIEWWKSKGQCFSFEQGFTCSKVGCTFKHGCHCCKGNHPTFKCGKMTNKYKKDNGLL